MPPIRTSPEPKARKMRKGTHSCFECRRRKIRCIFQENSVVCTECFARGSKCIDQEHATSEAIVDQRKNLRERVSKLEALVDTLLEERDSRSTGTPDALRNFRGDPFPHSPPQHDVPAPSEGGKDAPLMQMFNNDVLSLAESTTPALSPEELTLRAKTGSHKFAEGVTANRTQIEFECSKGGDLETNNDPQSSATKEKYEKTRRALLAPLPSYDEIIKQFNVNSDWWTTFRQKCPGTSGRYTSLTDFATQALTRGFPPQLGLLVLGIGISMDADNLEKYLSLVDREVASDDEYASGLEGMECLILMAKCYADIGQPRKAWICYRKGLAYAQLQGLHRNHSMSPERDSIWWVLYQGDRFISLLLGLPYGINDSHCDLELKGDMADHSKSPFVFLVNISRLAGKVIDRTQGTTFSSISSALDLDSDLERIASLVPPGWWDTATLEKAVVDSHRPQPAADLRERLLSQIAFYQIRVYLHLPFMLQSANNPRYEYSHGICLTSAREMLSRYHLLRAGTGQPLYECKAVDFLGFTASILVILGLFGYGKISKSHNAVQDDADWRMIEISQDIFQRASSERGGKVAAQSYKVLQMLSMARDPELYARCDSAGSPAAAAKVVIPYFGTISVRRGHKFTPPVALPSSANSTINTPPSASNSSQSPAAYIQNNVNHLGSFSSVSTGSPTHLNANNLVNTPASSTSDPLSLVYDGFYMPSGYDAAPTITGNEDDLGVFAQGSQNPFAMGAMDIDSDWNYFLNDSTSMGIGIGGGGGIHGQGVHQHSGTQAAMHGTYFP